MLEYIHGKWTANGSDIEMLYFILVLFICLIAVFYMSYRSNKQMSEIQHQIEMEKITRYNSLKKRNSL